MFCLNKVKQLNIFELNNLSTKQPTDFLNLLADNFDLNTFIPNSFKQHYYVDLGRDRKYNLNSVLFVLLIMQIFYIPKMLVDEVNKQKIYAKSTNNKNLNPYAATYKNMPKF